MTYEWQVKEKCMKVFLRKEGVLFYQGVLLALIGLSFLCPFLVGHRTLIKLG